MRIIGELFFRPTGPGPTGQGQWMLMSARPVVQGYCSINLTEIKSSIKL